MDTSTSLVLLLVLGVAAGFVFLLLIWAIATYNRLVSKRNQVNNAWSQIDVQLKRRHDLIPNLVNTLRGYLEHERSIFERLSEARARAIAAGNDVSARAEAEGELTSTLRSLFAVAEAYPELRSSQNVAHFQEELGSTENRIAFARQFYNDAVLEYNTTCQRFPAVLLAPRMGFNVASLFELETASIERAVPQVQL